jgi:hypothetical protein
LNVFRVKNNIATLKSPVYMKLRSRLFALSIGCLTALLASSHPLQAEQTNESPPAVKKNVFIFEGGNPIDLVLAIDKHFRTRLVQLLTLPDKLRKTQVPKLRVATEDPREVLSLYNRLDSPTLGQWRFEPTGAVQNVAGTNMNVLMLVPDKNAAAAKPDSSAFKVKAFPLGGVPEGKWDALAEDIELASQTGRKSSPGAEEIYNGTIRIQRESKVLIISGSEAYMETVESVINAYRMNTQLETKSAAGSKADGAAAK